MPFDINVLANLLRFYPPLTIEEIQIKSMIGLHWSGNADIYFCTPIGAEIIGWLGVDGIHFCFIPSLHESMVFVVSPFPCGRNYTEPIAYHFIDFLSLILSCRDAGLLEQISWINEIKFKQLLESEREVFVKGRDVTLDTIKNSFGAEELSEPYCYVKAIQERFDGGL